VIDVLLPFYGDPGMLREAVRSVLAQDCPDLRLVVVDDAYPDDSVAAWFADCADPRLEYHRNETNLGVNGNFARALSLARTDHVVFMGCDDLLEPGYVRAVTRALAQHPSAAVVAPGGPRTSRSSAARTRSSPCSAATGPTSPACAGAATS
jgi:glycosyltransferase involved in cell wall biosynthesis